MVNKKRRQAYFIFAAAGTIILLIIAVYFFAAQSPNDCQNAKYKTVILIDHSDPIRTQTKDEIIKRAENIIFSKVQKGEMVTIFMLTNFSKEDLSPKISICKPDMEGNRLIENVKMIKKKFEIEFSKPIKDTINKDVEGSPDTPLAQALIDISRTQYLRNADRARLVIFSDLFENTKEFSLYKKIEGANAVEVFVNSRGGKIARPTFKNVFVELHIIPRDTVSKDECKCRNYFWSWFFGDNTGQDAGLITDELPG